MRDAVARGCPIQVVVVLLLHKCAALVQPSGDAWTPVPYKCEVYDGCLTCVDDINCQWCGAEGRCAARTLGACDGAERKWCSMHRCSAHRSCTSCVRSPFCGFCALTNRCVGRYYDKPLGINCPASFFSRVDQCSNVGEHYQASGYKDIRVPARRLPMPPIGEGAKRDGHDGLTLGPPSPPNPPAAAPLPPTPPTPQPSSITRSQPRRVVPFRLKINKEHGRPDEKEITALQTMHRHG